LLPHAVDHFAIANAATFSVGKTVLYLSFVDEFIEIIVDLPLAGSGIVGVVSLIYEAASRTKVALSVFFSIDKLSFVYSFGFSQGSYMGFMLPVA
jgi:hypothetical protein